MKNNFQMGKIKNSTLIIASAVILAIAVLVGFIAVRKIKKSALNSVPVYTQQQTVNSMVQQTSGERAPAPETSQTDQSIDSRLSALDKDAADMDKPDVPLDVMGN